MRASIAGSRFWMAAAAGVVAAAACADEPIFEPTDSPPTIDLTAPAGGGTVAPGSTLDITWTASDTEGPIVVDLFYSADQEAGQVSIARRLSGSSYSWTVPNRMLFGVRVTAVVTDTSGQTASDASGDIFAVIAASAGGYVGSEACRTCHATAWLEVQRAQAGHQYALMPVTNRRAPEYPFSSVPTPPAGFTWRAIDYVIGGYGRMARFVDTVGYVMTDGVAGVNTQYNLARPDLAGGLPAQWAAYGAGATQPEAFTCGACHTTGWEAGSGTFVDPGVTCESCHGPGAGHVAAKDPSLITTAPTAEVCANCHVRDAGGDVLGSGGFLLHNQQSTELALGAHGTLDCLDCHDPHGGVLHGNAAQGGIVATCESCHGSKILIHIRPAECQTCHMAQATRAARSVHAYQADIRTHLFGIDTLATPRSALFTVDPTSGDTVVAQGKLTLDLVCYQCHRDPATGVGGTASQQSLSQLSVKARRIHP